MAYYRRPAGRARFSATTYERRSDGTCTERQHAWITSMLGQIEAAAESLPADKVAGIMALVGSLDVRLFGDWHLVPVSEASRAIDVLKGITASLPDPEANKYPGLPPHQRRIVAKFGKACRGCDGPIEAGVDLAIQTASGWSAWCMSCATTTPEQRAAAVAAAAAERLAAASAAQQARAALHGLHRFGSDIYRVNEDGSVDRRRGRQFRPVPESRMPLLNERTLLDAEGASQYGIETGRCCNCGDLIGHGDSRRSIAVGYGPVCAKRWGWFFPTDEEAEAIIARRQASRV